MSTTPPTSTTPRMTPADSTVVSEPTTNYVGIPTSSETTQSTLIGIVIGCVIGGLLLIVAVVIFIFIIRRR